MPESKLSGRDLVEAEVFRKRLENLTTEMAITLGRTSGSVHVTESKDFSTALFDADGNQIGFSGWVSFHVASSILGVEAVRDSHDLDEIRPGDIFCCNDPYTSGAMHQGDVGVVMPFFHEGELLGWGFVNEHVADVGGSAIGGMAPEARDVFSEAMRLPGVRIGRDYRIDPEWRRMIEVGVRVPEPVLNDIQSMVAGNNVGQEKLGKLVDRYGPERFRRLTSVAVDLSAEALRERISKLPDGRYRSTDWCEYDGHGEDLLLDASCELIVEGAEMTFAFSSESAQIDAFVNGAKPAVWGQCMTAVLCAFAYDIPVNAGLWDPISIDLGAEGTVVNPIPPAPVSNAHMEIGMRIAKLSIDVLSQACGISEDRALRSRVAAQPHDGFPVALLFGPNQYGDPWVTVFQDTAVGVGGGAQTVGDGLDCAGAHCMLGCGMPDIEIQELVDPKLFLYRRINTSSGGAGLNRGGLGVEEAAVIRGTQRIAGVGLSSVERVPPRGVGGGQPGAASSYFLLSGTGALAEFEAGRYPGLNDGERFQPPSKTGELVLEEGDVIVLRGGGGGGLGDPLFRDPAAVAADVLAGYVSEQVARALYGVVLAEGTADGEATEELRAEIRAERIGAEPSRAATGPPNPGVALDAAGACAACGTAVGEDAVAREQPLTEAFGRLGIDVRARPEGLPQMLLRERFCAACGSALAVGVAIAAVEPEAVG
ncbi:MAG: hydantoinase B/oxoprolinase family protein [Solirubrobacterales bacterium]